MDTKVLFLALVADVLDMDASDVREDSHFFQDLGASSLDIAELIWRIEDDPSWGVGEISDSDLVEMTRVGDVLRYINARRVTDDQGDARVDVALAADHFGATLKDALREYMERQGLVVRDLGVQGHSEAVDFPAYAYAVSHLVVDGTARRGILIGDTGVGMAIAANKIDGVRAAAVSDPLTSRLARRNYDTNILCLGAPLLGERVACLCVDGFLSTDFAPDEDGHQARQIREIERMEKRRKSSTPGTGY